MSRIVFLRDDDAGPLTPELRAVVELLIEERVPCNYAVVPAYLTGETAEYLRKKKREHQGLIEINQHGFLHEQVIRGRHRYSEFGGGRPYGEQLEAIREGKAIMLDMFREDFDPSIFTPPSNKFDENTLRVLRELGFTILSGLVKTRRHRRAVYGLGYALRRTHLFGTPISYHEGRVPKLGLLELSTAIDADEELNMFGNKRIKSADDLMRELARAERVQDVIGVMLHHATYRSRRKLDTLKDFVGRVRAAGGEFRTIETIARDLARGGAA